MLYANLRVSALSGFIPGLITIHDYYEHDLAQPDIDEDDFYCRYTLEVKGRKFDVSSFLFFFHRRKAYIPKAKANRDMPLRYAI